MINIVEKENIKYRHLPSTSVARPQWPCFCTHLYSHKMSKWIFNGLKLCCKQHNIIKQKNIIIANCPVFLQWQWRKTAMTKWSYEKYLLFNLWTKIMLQTTYTPTQKYDQYQWAVGTTVHHQCGGLIPNEIVRLTTHCSTGPQLHLDY